MLALLACNVASVDEHADATSVASLREYKIDPKAPCGTRCQVKRALGAWGDLVQIDVGSLMNKYSHMKVDRKAIHALKLTSIGFQKRVDKAERLLSEEDSGKLKLSFKHLKALDRRAKKKVAAIPRSGTSTRSKALAAAKAIDIEHKAVHKYERQSSDERALRHISRSSHELVGAVQKLSSRQVVMLSPSLSKPVEALSDACNRIQKQLQKTEMHGTAESHQQRVELESRVQALWKTFELHSKSAEGHKKVDDLKHQLKLLTAHKATIDQGFDADEAGPRAVLHEVIAKTHHTLNTELRKVVPSAVNAARVHKINRLFRHMKHSMERYDLLDQRFQASSAIVQKVAKLNSKKLAGASIEALELQMGEIKKGNEKRKLDPEPKPAHQTAPQLASDITDLLKLSDDMRSKRLEMRDQLKDHLASAKNMKHNLARAQSQLSKIETVQEFQEARLAKLHKHDQKTSHSSNNDSPDLGESMEDGGDSSVDALSTDIDSFLDDDDAAHEDDDPWLTDLIQISENSDQQDLSTTEQQEKIPFLTDEQSAKAFHSDSDSSLFAKHHAAAESEPKAAEPKEETKAAGEDDDATLEAAAKAAYETKHTEDDEDATEAVGEDNEATTEAAAQAAYEAKHNEDDNDDATKAVGEDNESTYQPSSQQRTDEPEAAATPDEGENAAQFVTAAKQDNNDYDDDNNSDEDEDPSFVPYQIN